MDSKPPAVLSPNTSAFSNRSSVRFREEPSRTSNVDLPERLRASDEYDAGTDTSPNQGPPMFMNMNQSIFGLIAAAGSRVDFNGRYDDGSSESEGEGNKEEDLSQTTILEPPSRKAAEDKQKKRLSGHKLLKSLPSLPKRKSKSTKASNSPLVQTGMRKENVAELIGDESTPPDIGTSSDEEKRPPVMGRMLEARAEIVSRPSFDTERASLDGRLSTDDDSTPLAKRLMDIFGFPEPEQVIEEYPCWLLQTVLLQGFLYITAKHFCFYAYLPKKAQMATKSGYLSKSGKRNPKFNRYWFRLKGNVLSYYQDSTNLYFPHGHIDLTYGISANVSDEDKDGCRFTVTTSTRVYNFRADSAPSAKEWVKSLQRVIFRSHNDGDSVKISLPISSVMEVKETQMMEFADTCRITFVDNDDETYAIDEYYFSFFQSGRDAIRILKMLVEDASTNRTVEKVLDGQKEVNQALPTLQTKQTASPKALLDEKIGTERNSESLAPNLDDSRLRQSEERDSVVRESSEFFLQSSTEDPSYSNLDDSMEDPSASQILQGSAVFHDHKLRQSTQESQILQRPSEQPKGKLTLLQQQSTQKTSTSDRSESLDPGILSQQAASLQSITKMGAYPLQRAGAFADYMHKTGKKMSSLLATESMGYVEKVSGMWKGGRKHYHEPAGLKVNDDDLDDDEDGETQTSNERFRTHFARPETERLQATYFGYILRVLPLYGKIYISDRSFCFRSLLPGTRTKLILPLKDIENVDKEKGFRFGYSGLVVVIRGHEELFFEFSEPELRDDCAITLLQSLETTKYMKESGLLEQEELPPKEAALLEREASKPTTQGSDLSIKKLQLPRQSSAVSSAPTVLLDDADASFLQFKPPKSMKITCLTIGSRGDVQPYIALCKGLLTEGHQPTIATHAEFQGWVESHGIGFARVEGDPGELMRLCIENGTFTWAFLREANATFRGWLDELLESAWHACKDADLLIESPSAMAGIHIAEKLGIPYFRAFTMPWTRTRAYPHAFIMPEHKMGGAYNYMTYVMFDNIFWKATAHQVNRWRNKTLGLPNTSLEKMQPNKVPFLYNFSPSVVAPPLDFSDWIRVTGYWFLDEADRYEPPFELADFIARARADGKKLVYVGFGSIIVNDPIKMTEEVIAAVLKADVRCILSKGWSDRISSTTKDDAPKVSSNVEPIMPPEIHVIKSAPHDWLFKQIDAAAHHGGSGTTGASLRAGIPTIIRPFFGDQFFFASRLEDLGVGVWVKRWGTNSFGRALWEATRNERMITNAKILGERIRKVCIVLLRLLC